MIIVITYILGAFMMIFYSDMIVESIIGECWYSDTEEYDLTCNIARGLLNLLIGSVVLKISIRA